MSAEGGPPMRLDEGEVCPLYMHSQETAPCILSFSPQRQKNNCTRNYGGARCDSYSTPQSVTQGRTSRSALPKSPSASPQQHRLERPRPAIARPDHRPSVSSDHAPRCIERRGQ